jgi:hypothetical protein
MSGRPDWVDRLFDALQPVIPPEFVGRVEINVFKGGIANVNVQQSFKGEPAAERVG